MVYQRYCRSVNAIDGFIHHAVLSSYDEVIQFEKKYGSSIIDCGPDIFPDMPYGEWKTEHKPLTDEQLHIQNTESMERMEKWLDYLD